MTTIPPTASGVDERRSHTRALLVLGRDLLVPLVLYYGSRLLGATPWLALLAGAGATLLTLVIGAVVRRRVERLALFTLSLIAIGTTVGLVTGDPQLLMARGSWLTVTVGLWFIGSGLFANRPLLFEGTLPLMPPSAAAQWRRDWDDSSEFRRVLRSMTLAFGLAFLIDAAARMAMAYTLPLDLVPLLSNLLLVLMLGLVVLAGKAYGRHLLKQRPHRIALKPHPHHRRNRSLVQRDHESR